MTNFTPTRTKNNYKTKLSKFLFVIATIIFSLCILIIAYPLAKSLVIIAVISTIVIYIMIVIFTLGIVLLDESFRKLFTSILSIGTSDELLQYYPTLTMYSLYALIIVVLLYVLCLLLVFKIKKTKYAFYVTNLIMLVLSSLTLIVLFIIKIII